MYILRHSPHVTRGATAFQADAGLQAACQAALSAAGQSSTGRDRTVPSISSGSFLCGSPFIGQPPEEARLLRTADADERLCRTGGLRGWIRDYSRFYGGSDVAVAQEASNGFVITGVVPQVDNSGGAAELVDGDSQTRRLLDPFCDLDSEQMRILRAAGGAWEQPISIRSTKEGGTILLDIFVDQLGEVVVELKGRIDAVLHVIVGEYKQVGRLQSSWPDQVFVETDGGEVGCPHRRQGQDGDSHRDLGHDSCLDGGSILQGSRPLS